jgi:predicted small secreted protein
MKKLLSAAVLLCATLSVAACSTASGDVQSANGVFEKKVTK